MEGNDLPLLCPQSSNLSTQSPALLHPCFTSCTPSYQLPFFGGMNGLGSPYLSTLITPQSQLNKGQSHSLAIMQFLRRLTLFSAQHQFILWAAHNSIAASLSCFSFQKFRHLAPESDLHPTPIPPFSATIFTQLHSWQTSLMLHKKPSLTVSPQAHSQPTLLAGIASRHITPPTSCLFSLWSICNLIIHAHSIQKIQSSTIQTYLAGINFFIKLVTSF